MGQRLVIEIADHGVVLANAYYHWSAYTDSAAQLTNRIIGYLKYTDPELTNFQKAVRALYKTGARISPLEETLIKQQGFFDIESLKFAFGGPDTNRNDGLLCVTKDGMDDSLSWEEGTVTIDINANDLCFNVLYTMTPQEYAEEYCEGDPSPIKEFPVFDLPEGYEFTYNEWLPFYSLINQFYTNGQYYFTNHDRSVVYCMIE